MTNLKIAGIVNVTPDSFSDGGLYFSAVDAIRYSLEVLHRGVDIIDIGGESTRPGAEEVTAGEEIRRTIPVIKGILREIPDAAISIDTYKSEVAKAALDEGVTFVNDISGGTFDAEMWKVVAGSKARYILMQTPGRPSVMQQMTAYSDVVIDVKEWLLSRAKEAQDAGISEVIIDPGIGFGKTVEQNLQIISNLDKFTNNGFDVLVGLSRKSFIGKYLGLETSERDFPSAMYEFFAALKGIRYIRTHNIENALKYRRILESLNV